MSIARHARMLDATAPAFERIPDAEIRRIRDIGRQLQTIRAYDESSVVVAFGAIGPDFDCPEGSVSVTVTKGGETATSAAVELATALMLARGKVNRQIAAKQKARDSDRSGEAGETGTGSTEGESAGPESIAQEQAA